jgi:transcriptional regulator with XRE-family HTH domain
VASRIEEVRTSLGMNQTIFAEKLGTRPSSVSKWEAGKNKPSPDVFVKIARLADGDQKLFFLEEAGVPLEYFEGAPMLSEIQEAATKVVAGSLRSGSTTLEEYPMTDTPYTIHLLKNPKKLGDPDDVLASNVEIAFNLPAQWFPKDSAVRAIRFEGEISPFISGELIALVDVSRKDPDRLLGCVVAVRTTNGVEPMKLRKDGHTWFLVPLREDAEHPVRVLRHDGAWSIVGKVLKWIGDAPSGK